jgi:hypothetical protein
MRISYIALEVLLSLLCMANAEHPKETILWDREKKVGRQL